MRLTYKYNQEDGWYLWQRNGLEFGYMGVVTPSHIDNIRLLVHDSIDHFTNYPQLNLNEVQATGLILSFLKDRYWMVENEISNQVTNLIKTREKAFDYPVALDERVPECSKFITYYMGKWSDVIEYHLTLGYLRGKQLGAENITRTRNKLYSYLKATLPNLTEYLEIEVKIEEQTIAEKYYY